MLDASPISLVKLLGCLQRTMLLLLSNFQVKNHHLAPKTWASEITEAAAQGPSAKFLSLKPMNTDSECQQNPWLMVHIEREANLAVNWCP